MYMWPETFSGFLIATALKGEAIRKPKEVSIITCAYFIFLKSEIWVSICNNWLSISPQELTPLYGTGRNWGHWEQVFTIWHAHSLKIPNYYLKPLLFWWCKEWDYMANCTCVRPLICLGYKSAVTLP